MPTEYQDCGLVACFLPRVFRKWGTLAVLSLALAIILIDSTLLNVALSTLIRDLKTTAFIASISHSFGVLLLGESIIEGIGAALMMPATTSLLVAKYRGHDRAIAFGIWGAVAAAATAIGPILGGFLTTHSSWRWGFRINLFVVALFALWEWRFEARAARRSCRCTSSRTASSSPAPRDRCDDARPERRDLHPSRLPAVGAAAFAVS